MARCGIPSWFRLWCCVQDQSATKEVARAKTSMAGASNGGAPLASGESIEAYYITDSNTSHALRRLRSFRPFPGSNVSPFCQRSWHNFVRSVGGDRRMET